MNDRVGSDSSGTCVGLRSPLHVHGCNEESSLSDRGNLLRRRAAPVGVCLLGLLAFAIWGGGHALSPVHIGWIMSGFDTPAHYLGWEYFRHAPWGQWPLGANPAYGADAPGTIVLSDVIPLLAYAFKAIGPWLPADFQYVGFWLLGCFVLQAWFGYQLMGRLAVDPWLRLLGCGFFLASSIMLMRVYLHPALAGQWIVLAALYLALDARFRPRAWGVLLIVAALVHAYLLVMAGAIWFVAMLGRALCRLEPTTVLMRHLVMVLVSVVLVMWVTGYFVPSSVTAVQNTSHTNLLAPIWTGICGLGEWSAVLPCLQLTPDAAAKTGDGFGYFGLGFLLLVPLAIGLRVLKRPIAPYPTPARLWLAPLVACLILLLFAIGNVVYVGNYLLLSFGLPPSIERVWTVFRGAARMEWPMWYLLLLLCLGVVISRLGTRTARAALALLLLVQCADLSTTAISTRRDLARRSHFHVTLVAPVWSSLALKHKHLVYLPTAGVSPYLITWIPHYRELAHYAATRGLSINIAYLARLDLPALAAARKRREALLIRGEAEPDTFYVIEDGALWAKVLCATDHGQWHGHIDGLPVLVPAPGRTTDLPVAETCSVPRH